MLGAEDGILDGAEDGILEGDLVGGDDGSFDDTEVVVSTNCDNGNEGEQITGNSIGNLN